MCVGTATPALASSHANTGRACVQQYYFDAQSIQHLGSRCAQAYNDYTAVSSTLYRIDDYYIRYDVTAGLSYGPHNNENPWKVAKGYNSGTQAWLSPDSGNANLGYFKRDQGTTYTYRGQTVINIDAYPDVPNVADPKLNLDTAQF